MTEKEYVTPPEINTEVRKVFAKVPIKLYELLRPKFGVMWDFYVSKLFYEALVKEGIIVEEKPVRKAKKMVDIQ